MLQYILLALTISVFCNDGYQFGNLNSKRSDNSEISNDFKESSGQLINKLVNLLKAALKEGRETFQKVINDEDVKEILEHLGPLSKKIALSIIQGFKDILDRIDNATKPEPEFTKRGIKESSAQLINKLVNLLKEAMKQGQEAFDKVVNDEDVRAILDRLGPLSRKIADSIIQGFKDLLDKIDNATKDQSKLYKRDLKETSASLLTKLLVLLKKAFDQGLETYKKVINDEDVKAILEHMGPLSRRVAESLIQGFQNVLEKIDQATSDQPEGYKRGIKETSAQLINKLIHLLKDAFEQGRDAYEKVINDKDVQAILEHLGPLSRKVAESIIQGFKDILDNIDNATKQQSDISKREIKETYAQLINKLVNLFKNAMEQGREAFDKAINDEDVKAILNHLGPLSRKVADSIIQGFKDLLDKIDNATKEDSELSKRGLKESSYQVINKVVNLLKDGFEQGREAFEKVVNDKDVQVILEHLGPLSRKFVQAIINGFYDLLDQIDLATKAHIA